MTRKSISHLSKSTKHAAKCAVAAIGVSLLVPAATAAAAGTPAAVPHQAPAPSAPSPGAGARGVTVPTANAVANPLGTAEATAGQVNLDLELLGGVLGALHLTGGPVLDVPLANLFLGRAIAPTATGDAVNFTNSTLRMRDNLLADLNLSGTSANLLNADAVSGTARVVKGPGGYAQAYATLTNLRVFLPLVNLPGADPSNGVMKIDLVSAQATCAAGQKPTASAKMPTTILLLGHAIPVPLTGDVPLDLGPLGTLDVHLTPTAVEGASGAAAAVEARISVDAVGLAKVSGAITLASATCTSPAVSGNANPNGAGAGGAATTAGTSGSAMSSSGAKSQTIKPASPSPTATATGGEGTVHAATVTPLAETGTDSAIWPLTGIAAASILLGTYLLGFRKRIKEEDTDGDGA